MILEGWEDVIPVEDITLLEKGRLQEVRQPLMDLGFLKNGQPLATAIIPFRKAYQSLHLLPDLDINLGSNDIVDGLELNLLHELTALDGDFVLDTLPTMRSVNLASRVIHYRLEILGLFDKNVETPFSSSTIKQLDILNNWLNHSFDHLTLVNLIGDIPRLIKEILSKGKLDQRIVCFKYGNVPPSDAIEEVNEEQEEHDDEQAMQLLEAEIDKELEVVEANKKISDQEKVAIEKLEKRTQNKRRRVERVETLMSNVLVEQKTLLGDSLKKENQAKREIKRLTDKKDKLEINGRQLQHRIDKKEEDLKQFNQELNAIGTIQSLQRQILFLQQDQNLQLKVLNDTVLESNTVKLRQHFVDIQKQIKQLDIEIGVLRMGRIRKEKKKLRKEVEQKQVQLKKALSFHEKELTIRKKIIQVNDEIKKIQPIELKRNEAQMGIASFTAQFIVNKEEIKTFEKAVKQQEKNLANILTQRNQEQGAAQLELKQLNNRLERLLEKINKLNFRFKAKLKKSLSSSFYAEVRREIFKNRNTVYLEQVIADPFNQFLIRLVQIHQWMNGYYFGKLDSALRAMSFDSLVELVEDIPHLRLKYVLTKLGDQTSGYWVLNIHYFLDRMVAEVLADDKQYSAADVIEKYELEFDRPDYRTAITDEAWTIYKQDHETGLEQVDKIRRIYFGIRTLARSIIRGFGRLIRFIIKGVRKLITIFKNFINILYKEIREGFRKFSEGMSFLFGNRLLETKDASTGNIIQSKYDFDFDMLIVTPNRINIEAIIQHQALSLRYTQNLNFSLVLTAKIIKWAFRLIKAGTLISWPQLALRIAIYFKKQIIQWLKKKRPVIRLLKHSLMEQSDKNTDLVT